MGSSLRDKELRQTHQHAKKQNSSHLKATLGQITLPEHIRQGFIFTFEEPRRVFPVNEK